MRRMAGVMIVLGLLAGGSAARAGDDMWSTLKSVGKTPAQLEAEKKAERDAEAVRRAREKARARGLQLLPGTPEEDKEPSLDEAQAAAAAEASTHLAQSAACYQKIQVHQGNLIAQVLERKLKTDRSLTQIERKSMEEDLAGLRNGQTVFGGEIAIRALGWLTPEDQRRIADEMVKFAEQSADQCKEVRAGGQ